MRTASGVPNLAGEWAAEQRVMSDPRGQSGTLVPLGDAAKMKPGDVPAVRAFSRCTRLAESLAADPIKAASGPARPVKLTEAGTRIARFQSRVARESATALRAHEHPVRLDLRLRGQPRDADADANHHAVRPHGPARVIHLDQKAVPAGVKPTRAGYSIGRWEADTLVVETSAFLPACSMRTAVCCMARDCTSRNGFVSRQARCGSPGSTWPRIPNTWPSPCAVRTSCFRRTWRTPHIAARIPVAPRLAELPDSLDDLQ